MVRIGTVWDRTVEVINGRTAILVAIAALMIFLPVIVRDALGLVVSGSVAAKPLVTAVGIIIAVLTIWGTLALTAVASDPAIDQPNALRVGGAALPSTIGLLLLLVIALTVAFVPGLLLLASSGFDFTAAAANQPQTHVSPGSLGGFALYSIVYFLFLVWVGARLAVLYAVVVNERRGFASFARSFALTRGLTWKIIGVLILYAIVFSVVLVAATSVTGLILRLILGSEHTALVAFFANAVGGIATTVFAVLQSVFTAQLYVAARDAHDGASSPA